MSDHQTLIAGSLRVESMANPEGLDTCSPRFSWTLSPVKPTAKDLTQSAFQVLAASTQELLDADKGDLWDSKKSRGAETFQVSYQGHPLHPFQKVFWKVRSWDQGDNVSSWSQSAQFTMGPLSTDDWADAKWISEPNPQFQKEDTEVLIPPVPYFRKEFTSSKPIARAILSASALGNIDVEINGKLAGDQYFMPGWSDYNKRVYFKSFEVTELINDEVNCIGIALFDGWYADRIGWITKRNRYGSEPQVCVSLRLEYTDGTVETIGTDETWKTSHGALREASFQMGETYDANQEIKGWSVPGLDDKGWDDPKVNEAPKLTLCNNPGNPVVVNEVLSAKVVHEPQPGVYVADMNQNMVGVPSVKLVGQKGQKVVFRFAEMLNPDGTLYTTNLRAARCIDTYIPSEDGEFTYTPRMTFHGYRYIEISGCVVPPNLEDIKGLVLHNAMESTGQFECSDIRLNKLVENIKWGMKGNYLEAPTDCPQRDERLGWTGDALAFIPTASYLMNISPFYSKWMLDVNDSQHDSGAYTDVVPDIGAGAGNAAWADAGIGCPYRIWKVYGDKEIIRRHYPRMKKYIEYLKNNSQELIRPDDGFGDWLSLKADSPKPVVNTAWFAQSARYLSEMAAAIGEDQEAEEYTQLYEDIKKAFQDKFVGGATEFVSQHTVLAGETQTVYALALAFDLFCDDMVKQGTKHLLRDLQVRNYHLSTGFMGLPWLMPVLSKVGLEDVAFKLLFNETFPSWLYEVLHGATTIWERWDGWSEEFGFQDPNMNSFNHYAYGAVGAWIFEVIGGINIDEIHKGELVIYPRDGGQLTSAQTSFQSIHGPVHCGWFTEKGLKTVTCRIPVNTKAKIILDGEVVEGGDGLTASTKDGQTIYQVGSGQYCFKVIT